MLSILNQNILFTDKINSDIKLARCMSITVLRLLLKLHFNFITTKNLHKYFK